MKKAVYLLFGTLLLFLSFCSYLPHKNIESMPRYPNYTVAVLPLYNFTNNINGPNVVRAIFHEKIKKYFSVKPIAETDEILKDRLGITLGTQLDMATPQQLGEELKVDAVVYGYLLNFDDITSGIYNARKVRAGFRLIDAKTGSIVWARGQGIKTVSGLALPDVLTENKIPSIYGLEGIEGIDEWQIMLQKALNALQEAQPDEFIDSVLEASLTSMPIGSQVGEKMFGRHLAPETVFMVNKIVETLNDEKRQLFSLPLNHE